MRETSKCYVLTCVECVCIGSGELDDKDNDICVIYSKSKWNSLKAFKLESDIKYTSEKSLGRRISSAEELAVERRGLGMPEKWVL